MVRALVEDVVVTADATSKSPPAQIYKNHNKKFEKLRYFRGYPPTEDAWFQKEIEKLGINYAIFQIIMLIGLVLVFIFVLAELDHTYSFTRLLFGNNPLLSSILIALPIVFRLLEAPQMASFIQRNKENMFNKKINEEYDQKFIRIEFGRLFLLALAVSIGLLLLAGQSWIYFLFIFPALFIFDLLTIYCSLIAVKLFLVIILCKHSDGKPKSEESQNSKPVAPRI